MKQITRALLRKSTLAVASAGIGLPLLPVEASSDVSNASRKLKVIVAGAHPDDPESGCGGTIALYSDLGHDVAMLYSTRGEAGIPSKGAEEAAAIRTAECQKACAILRAPPIFARQIKNAEISPARYADFAKVLQAEHPDIVFTHWPIDTQITAQYLCWFMMPGSAVAESLSCIILKSIRVRKLSSFIRPII